MRSWDAVDRFAALGSETRFHILSELAQMGGSAQITQLAEDLSMPRTSLKRQLERLEDVEFVSMSRRGRTVWVEINTFELGHFLSAVGHEFGVPQVGKQPAAAKHGNVATLSGRLAQFSEQDEAVHDGGGLDQTGTDQAKLHATSSAPSAEVEADVPLSHSSDLMTPIDDPSASQTLEFMRAIDALNGTQFADETGDFAAEASRFGSGDTATTANEAPAHSLEAQLRRKRKKRSRKDDPTAHTVQNKGILGEQAAAADATVGELGQRDLMAQTDRLAPPTSLSAAPFDPDKACEDDAPRANVISNARGDVKTALCKTRAVRRRPKLSRKARKSTAREPLDPGQLPQAVPVSVALGLTAPVEAQGQDTRSKTTSEMPSLTIGAVPVSALSCAADDIQVDEQPTLNRTAFADVATSREVPRVCEARPDPSTTLDPSPKHHNNTPCLEVAVAVCAEPDTDQGSERVQPSVTQPAEVEARVWPDPSQAKSSPSSLVGSRSGSREPSATKDGLLETLPLRVPVNKTTVARTRLRDALREIQPD